MYWNNESMNLHESIIKSINEHFRFIHDLGFPEFKEEQYLYEFHFYSKQNSICINIQYEISYAPLVEVKINSIPINIIENNNKIIQDIYKRRDEIHTLKLKPCLKKAEQQISKGDKLTRNELDCELGVLNDCYIYEIANILKRNKSILHGDLEILKKAYNEKMNA